MPSADSASDLIIRVAPYHYIHVLDSNTNVVRVVCGPSTYTRPEHEKVLQGPTKMMTIPPRHYLVVNNPCVRDSASKEVLLDVHGMVRLKHGDKEIRHPDAFPDPFPLYPGEELEGGFHKLLVVEVNQALRLKVVRDFTDGTKSWRAGDEYLFKGPGTYLPRVEVEERDIVDAVVVTHSQALLLRAQRETTDIGGVKRKAGEEWLHREIGAYLPSIDEELVMTVHAVTLTDQKALHVRAKKTFTDVYGKRRKAGEEWLVTVEDAESHIPDVYEEILGTVTLTTLTSRQYCVVLNPFNPKTNEQRLGGREVRVGECSFFLRPNESLENGLEDIYILADDEALLLQAIAAYEDPTAESASERKRQAGDRWLVRGPREFVPDINTKVIERRKAISLDVNEGVYVRNTSTGQVRSVIGKSYMLTAQEELWEKEMPQEVEELLAKQMLGQAYVPPAHHAPPTSDPKTRHQSGGSSSLPLRDKTRIVQFRVPNNCCVQVFDFAKKTSRVVVGPDLVILSSDEQFTTVRLSGDTPKRPNVIHSLALMLGPDFCSDEICVETSDHARLRVRLAYNWVFKCDRTSQQELAKCFDVRDFIGDAAKALASRIRGAVASETFDRFHKHSAKIVRGSIFGIIDGKIGEEFRFPANNLYITNVDVQSVEPVDASTMESLQKSVQLAIEITTDSQEARARHEAHREEAMAEGSLIRQKLDNEAEAEQARKRLLELQAESKAVEAAGAAISEARARSEAARIENEGLVSAARMRAEALAIQRKAELDAVNAEQNQELEHMRRRAEIEIQKAKELASIDADKFQRMVSAIGADTIAEIARAGPEMQAKLLGSLGIKSVLLTDGRSPVNLFNTAGGLIGTDPTSATGTVTQ